MPREVRGERVVDIVGLPHCAEYSFPRLGLDGVRCVKGPGDRGLGDSGSASNVAHAGALEVSGMVGFFSIDAHIRLSPRRNPPMRASRRTPAIAVFVVSRFPNAVKLEKRRISHTIPDFEKKRHRDTGQNVIANILSMSVCVAKKSKSLKIT